jgi:hypothetical protein
MTWASAFCGVDNDALRKVAAIMATRSMTFWPSLLQKTYRESCARAATPASSGTFLCRPVMTLVDSHDAGPAAADVVQHRLGDLETDAQALQSGRNRPAQVVNAPRHDRYGACGGCRSLDTGVHNGLVERGLRLGLAGERGAQKPWKHDRAVYTTFSQCPLGLGVVVRQQSPEQIARRATQGHHVRNAVLGPLARYGPRRQVLRNLPQVIPATSPRR